MNESGCVRGGKAVGNLNGNIEKFLWIVDGGYPRPLDAFHHQKVRSDVEQSANVGMIQRSYSPRFSREPVAELLLRKLDGDDPVEPRVPRLPHGTHSSGGYHRKHFVRT